MQYLMRVCAFLAVLAGLVGLSGFLLPARHEAGMSIHVQATPEAVWAVLAAVEDYPRWRSDVSVSEIIRSKPTLAWRQSDSKGRASLHTEGPGRLAEKWVDRLSGGKKEANGSRTFLIVADAVGGSTIGLTEVVEIPEPLARFRARFMTGYSSELNSLLNDLKRRLGE
jgi:hypothetical protein